jgi:hypothetical protein
MPHSQQIPPLKRFIIRWAETAAFRADFFTSNVFIELSPAYFEAVTVLFQKQQVLPDHQQGKAVAEMLERVLTDLLGHSPVSLTLRAVFEQHESQLLELYDRADGCVTLRDINFFNALYVYLDPATAAILRQKVADANLGVTVTESTPVPFASPAATVPVAVPIHYQSLMGIPSVWAKPGGTGTNANAVVAEVGFRTDRSTVRKQQPELCVPISIVPPPPPARDDRRTQAVWNTMIDQAGTGSTGGESHSDHTLSVLLASHSYHSRREDYKGIIPDIPSLKLVSFRQIITNPPTNHEEIGVLKAISYAQKGTVLLIELQMDYKPIEIGPLFFWLIYIATHCFGITVIEPVGNANLDIDMLYPATPTTLPHHDSGAILVGAAELESESGSYKSIHNYSLTQKDRFTFAPVPVPVFDSLGNSYGGTSAASAVIAGVACQIQSIYFAKYGRYLTPPEMRTKLCNNRLASCNVVKLGTTTILGYIPDVSKIVDTF